ncbi:unnamed protein product [Meloidogyne enterolobii]|uniref:Uncharacterized protein n=1 Tax=Meloidogyne enterolobii TaxID=390850 RepID=A0ACB1BBI3_MELEN
MEKSEEAIISAQADFAINLLSNVVFGQNKPVESTIISPLSLSMGLAIVYAGADGETKEEFGNLLSGGKIRDETGEGLQKKGCHSFPLFLLSLNFLLLCRILYHSKEIFELSLST